MKIVSNTSPLVFLAKIKKLDLLSEYSILIPEQVLNEIRKGKDLQYEDSNIILDFIEKNNFAVKDIKIDERLNKYNISDGEKAAITLALNEKSILLLDERKARTIAGFLGIKVRGTLGVIKEALDNKKISREETKNLIEKLIKEGYRIDEALLIDFLKRLS